MLSDKDIEEMADSLALKLSVNDARIILEYRLGVIRGATRTRDIYEKKVAGLVRALKQISEMYVVGADVENNICRGFRLEASEALKDFHETS